MSCTAAWLTLSALDWNCHEVFSPTLLASASEEDAQPRP